MSKMTINPVSRSLNGTVVNCFELLLIGENCAYLSHLTYYVGKCDNPLKVIQTDVIIVGYEDPPLEGENITFTCPTEAILSEPNSSTCMGMENGNQTLGS